MSPKQLIIAPNLIKVHDFWFNNYETNSMFVGVLHNYRWKWSSFKK